MLKKVLSAWRRNHGTQLFAIGCGAGLIMCIMWYKQWLPELNIAGGPANFTRQADKLDTTSYFVAHITGPIPTAESLGKKGFISLFAYNDSPDNEERLPVVTQEFQLDIMGTATIVQELTPGLYTAFAFLDLNDNGRIDLDEHGTPLEPFRTSAPTAGPQDFNNLEPAAFRVNRGRPYFCLMLFVQ